MEPWRRFFENKKLFFGASGAALFLSCIECVNRTVEECRRNPFSAYNQETKMAQVTRANEVALVPKVPLLMTETSRDG